MIGARQIEFRQLLLFGLIGAVGLFLTAFVANEVYRNAVVEARSQFRQSSDRLLALISTEISNINASITRFGDVFALTGEPDGLALAEFVDSYTSINAAEAVTTLLVVAADSVEQRARVFDLIREINTVDITALDDLPAVGTPNGIIDGYYLSYVGVRERDVSVDGGASLVGLDLSSFEGYRQLLDQVLTVRQTDFAIIHDKLSPNATDYSKLVIASPFEAEIGNAYLVEVVHLDVLVERNNPTRLIGEIEFSNMRGNSAEAGSNRMSIAVGEAGTGNGAPASGDWESAVNINVGLGGLEIRIRASEEAYAINMQNVMQVALVGLLITGLVTYLAYDQVRRSNRVVEIVNRRTRALKEAHAELEHHNKLLQNLNTDVEEARKAAEAANMAKSEFLATMSHELRTPLNAILGFSEILETETLGPLGDKRYTEYASDIHSSGRHLLSIINDILDLAKLEAGRVKIEENPIEPRSVVERAMGLLSHQAEEKHLEFDFYVTDSMPQYIIGDELRLRQVVINLASNAIKFTQEGSVNIRMHPKPFKTGAAGWVLEVQDTGIGIPEDKQSILFDRFTQVDNTHARRHGGVGLGLAICRELVNRMEGMISVRSISGVGTTIRVHLPLDLASPDDDDGSLI